MGNKRKVTKDKFDDVKRKLSLGLSYRTIAPMCGISFHSVYEIANSNSFESYIDRIVKYGQIQRKRGKNMGSGVAITEELYKQIKQSVLRGVATNKIAEVFGLNPSTVSRLKQTETYEEYRNKMCGSHKETNKDIDLLNKILCEIVKQTELLERMVSQWQT